MLPSLRRTFLNVSFLWADKLASIVVSFFITGLATRFFGLEQMGLWLFIVNAATYIQLFDFGSSAAMPRVIPAMKARGDQGAIDDLIRSAYVLSWGVALLGMVGTAGLYAASLFGWFSFEAAGGGQVKALYALVFGVSFWGLPYRAGSGLLAAVHRFDHYALIDLIATLAKALCVVLLIVLLRGDFLVYAATVLLVPLIGNIYQFKAGLRWNEADPKRGAFSKKAMRLLLSHCGASLIVTFSSMVLIQGTTLLSGKLGATSVAVFGYPLQLVLNAMSFSVALGALLSPMASTLHGGNDKKGMIRISLRSIRMACGLSVLLALLLLTTGPFLMKLWIGGPKVEAASLDQMILIMKLLAVGSVFLTPGSLLRGILMGVGRQWPASLIELGSSVLGLAMGWVLMDGFHAGLMGLTAGVMASYVARGVFILPFYGAKVIGFSLSELLLQGLGVPCLLGAAIWFPTERLFDALAISLYSPVYACVSGALASLLWGLGFWFYILDPESKKRVIDGVKRRMKQEGGA